MSPLPKTQKAIAMSSKRTPLVEITAPIQPPSAGEILVHVHWTASTPLDLHKADGGLLISSFPHRTGGGGAAGKVVAVGPSAEGTDLKGLDVGDLVVAFAFAGDEQANHQEYITIPAYLASKIPANVTMQEAVTVSVNLVTVFHAATTDLGLNLPWPIPKGYSPPQADKPILIWGASSSVGLFAVQVFRHYGYRRILAVSSGKHHAHLRSIGATACFDYQRDGVVGEVLDHVKDEAGAKLPYILDCIGSLHGTLRPLAKVAQRGSVVAVMLPVIVKDATVEEEPEYEMDVANCWPGEWAEGVVLRGVRTHFYLENEFYKQTLQPEIVPALIAQGVIQPNPQRIVEGSSTLERAQNALDLLRSKAVSGEKLVWKVSEV